MQDFYPASQPFNQRFLQVDPVHSLYYEEFGKRGGLPIVYLHGGPGGGHAAFFHRFFDPSVFHIVIYDQRGAGQSVPFANVQDNTPDHLVEDLEKLRVHFGFEKWHLFGGSWGSTLALLYAEAYPEKVSSLTLRGIFMMRQKELDCFYNSNILFPEEFEKLAAYIPEAERGDMLKAYFTRISGGDKKAARIWSRYEASTSCLRKLSADELSDTETDNHLIGMATMETHFFVNCRFDPDDRILQNIGIIRKAAIPGFIVQGRYDAVCPAESARDLKKAWPEAQLEMVVAGHASKDPEIRSALVKATNSIRDTGSPVFR